MINNILGALSNWFFMDSMDFVERSWDPWNFPRIFHENFHGIHENFMDPMKFSWVPWNFHGFHENFVGSMKISWIPRNFHGVHENFVGSMKFSWTPWNFHGIHGNSVDSTRFHGIHEFYINPWNFMVSMKFHGLHENFDTWKHLN